MASTNLPAGSFNVGAGWISGERIRSIDEQFRRLPGNKAPTVGLVGYGEAVTFEDGATEKIVDRQLQQTITLTAQLPNTTASGTTLTASAADIAALQAGQTLLIGDEVVRVSTPGTSTTAGIERAFGGSTIATQATSAVARIMSPLYVDTASFPKSPGIRGEMKKFYIAQIMYGYEGSAMRTSERSYLTRGLSDVAFEEQNHMEVALSQLEMMVWYGKAIKRTDSQPGSFDGLARLITSNEVTASGALSVKLLNDLMEKHLRWDNSNDQLTIFGNRTMKRIWDTVFNAQFDRKGEPDYVGPVKIRTDRFETSLGTFNFVVVPNLKDGELYSVKLDDVKLNPAALQEPWKIGWGEVRRGPEETNALVSAINYYWLGTLTIGDERLHGKMTGISVSSGDYSNMTFL